MEKIKNSMTKIVAIIIILVFTNIVKIEAQCLSNFTPDLALLRSSTNIQAEIDVIYNAAKNRRLAKSQPSITALNNAISAYNTLGIATTASTISGNSITSYNEVSFISTFADYLKFNPTDSAMIERVNKTVWWTYTSLCNNTLPVDHTGYVFRYFSRKGFFCIEFLTPENKERILYIIEKELENWNVFWKPNYDYNSQLIDGAINSDIIYNKLDALIPLIKCFGTNDEQYRYMLTLKRYITRFVSVYTNGTRDGLKPDGSGYHHWNNYEAYMYAYNTIVYCLKIFDNSSFQIDSSAYLVFRNAILHKLLTTNDAGMLPLTMTGRTGDWDNITINEDSVRDLAIIGGNILGLTTADPILAGIYNRRHGVELSFNYNKVASFEDGFYQINHSSAGVFRTNNTVVISRGFNNVLWGSEIYATENRYGRYQSYGTLSVIYSGDEKTNGFNNQKWDWNYNPGATTKVLPWEKLIAGSKRVDEYSNKRFSGSLQFNLQNKGFLDKIFGTYGMFAMDFQEKINLGFGGVTTSDTHDPTFTFKKSNFYFNDIIICLGSNINSTDLGHSIITTLYQNCTTPSDIIVNNGTYSTTGVTTTYSESKDNWVLDNFGTGFYIQNKSGDLKVQRKNQTTPSQNQNDPSILNPATQAAIGFLDHGAAPINKDYEYVVVPNTNTSNMQSLATSFGNTSTKPYEILNKDSNSHIIQHKATEIYGFALFEPNKSIPGNTNIVTNDYPCLVMYESLNFNTEMKLSLSNPDMGLPEKRSYDQFIIQPIQITFSGEWELVQSHPDISLVSSNSCNTTFSFSTYQGLPIETTFQKKAMGKTLCINNTVNSILIYPNPSKDIIRVKNAEISLSNTKFYNLLGQEFTNLITIDNDTIDISKLPVGTYILKVNTFTKFVCKK